MQSGCINELIDKWKQANIHPHSSMLYFDELMKVACRIFN